jgi:hypothetical protein
MPRTKGSQDKQPRKRRPDLTPRKRREDRPDTHAWATHAQALADGRTVTISFSGSIQPTSYDRLMMCEGSALSIKTDNVLRLLAELEGPVDPAPSSPAPPLTVKQRQARAQAAGRTHYIRFRGAIRPASYDRLMACEGAAFPEKLNNAIQQVMRLEGDSTGE